MVSWFESKSRSKKIPMLIDDVTIKVRAGDGGDGAVAFNKNMMSLGPVGGDGGNGGNVIFEGCSDLSALAQFRRKKEVDADDGGRGLGQSVDGSRGKDEILKIPIGTVITNTQSGKNWEIIKTGEQVTVARGGRGGRGNFKFRSAINTSPREYEEGTSGETATLRLELKLVADVGLIGLPNAGKSSLLNELTNAKSKVANYAFTTLEPNLGTYYELILADIPGLIEGASGGKGLGIKFLKHIERTNILFHLISAESEDVVKDYHVIRNELTAYSAKLAEKEEYIFLTKSDMVKSEDLEIKLSTLREIDKDVISISIHDEDSLKKVMAILNVIKSRKEIVLD